MEAQLMTSCDQGGGKTEPGLVFCSNVVTRRRAGGSRGNTRRRRDNLGHVWRSWLNCSHLLHQAGCSGTVRSLTHHTTLANLPPLTVCFQLCGATPLTHSSSEYSVCTCSICAWGSRQVVTSRRNTFIR